MIKVKGIRREAYETEAQEYFQTKGKISIGHKK
jgi:hypothetical protein